MSEVCLESRLDWSSTEMSSLKNEHELDWYRIDRALIPADVSANRMGTATASDTVDHPLLDKD